MFRIDLAAQADRNQNGDLRARVVAVDIGRRIRLGVTERLRLFQRIGKREPRAVHAGEDVVAGAVQDAGHAQQPIAGEPFPDGANDRNAAGHRRLEQQLALMLPRERQQLDAVRRDELLVGRDDRLAACERSPDEIARRLETAHQLDDDVGVGCDDVVDAVGPVDAGRYPVDLLALDAAIADGRQLQRRMNPARQHLRHRPPDRAETDDGDFQRSSAWCGCRPTLQTRINLLRPHALFVFRSSFFVPATPAGPA